MQRIMKHPKVLISGCSEAAMLLRTPAVVAVRTES